MPDVGRSSPAATFRNVLLPDPDGPMTAVNEPAGEPDADAVERDDRAVSLAVDLADIAERHHFLGGDLGGLLNDGRVHSPTLRARGHRVVVARSDSPSS